MWFLSERSTRIIDMVETVMTLGLLIYTTDEYNITMAVFTSSFVLGFFDDRIFNWLDLYFPPYVSNLVLIWVGGIRAAAMGSTWIDAADRLDSHALKLLGMLLRIYGLTVYGAMLIVFAFIEIVSSFANELSEMLQTVLGAAIPYISQFLREPGVRVVINFDPLRVDVRRLDRELGFSEETIQALMPLNTNNKPPPDRDSCVICREDIENMWRITPCGHAYHANCVDPWFRTHETCPTCNTTIGEDDDTDFSDATSSRSDSPRSESLDDASPIDESLRNHAHVFQGL